MTDLTTLPDRALSIRQPWAWAILNAGKDIENRSWRTLYRGPICIHASLYKPNAQDKLAFTETLVRAIPDFKVFAKGIQSKEFKGGIIGTAEIVDCVDHSDSPWFTGPYGFVLANVQPVPFIPVKGAQGMFKWKEKLEVA